MKPVLLRVSLVLAAVVVLFAYIYFKSYAPRQVHIGPDPTLAFAQWPAIFSALEDHSEFIVWEGLPHPGWEREIFAESQRSNPVIRYEEHCFYANPLEVSDSSRDELKELASKPASFLQFRGWKACGGFHPDYALEWRTPQGPVNLLICFGCEEYLVTGAGKRIHGDVEKQAMQRFQELLKPLRTLRPLPEDWVEPDRFESPAEKSPAGGSD